MGFAWPFSSPISSTLPSLRSVAFLALLSLCSAPRLSGIVFRCTFFYAGLCGFFYSSALAYYVHIRERGVSLQAVQLLGFLSLSVMALNCKGMAVTLPV